MRPNIWITSLFCLLASIPLSAQFGGGVKYQALENTYWEQRLDDLPDGYFASDIIGISAYYWFRLKEVRVEFMPEVGYSISVGQNDAGLSTDINVISALLNVHIYPFDLISDCDCPTFSKQGSGLQKGFFIELTGGLDHYMLDLVDASDSNLFEASESLPRYGIGIGFDIGVSDLFTLTPTVFRHWTGNAEYAGLGEAIDGIAADPCECKNSYTGIALRAIFRPDYLKRR